RTAMNYEDGFLDAIRQEPDDEAVRLVYADWLEEQGGHGQTARAEFIRVQLRLVSMSEDDPHYPELSAREEELPSAHEKEWLGEGGAGPRRRGGGGGGRTGWRGGSGAAACGRGWRCRREISWSVRRSCLPWARCEMPACGVCKMAGWRSWRRRRTWPGYARSI